MVWKRLPAWPMPPGVPDETEAPALSTEAVDQEFAEMHPEAQESSVPEPAERTYAEDLELLFGDAPVADAPQVEPSPVAPEPAMEAPMLVSPEGEEGSKADPGSSQQAEAAPEGAAEEPSESLPSSVSADDVARAVAGTFRGRHGSGACVRARGCAGRSRQRRRAASGAFLRP